MARLNTHQPGVTKNKERGGTAQRTVIFGDPIGGPLAPVFGTGVKDKPVAISPWWRGRTPLAHTSYWLGGSSRKNGGKPTAIDALREAVDLESGRWLDDHLAELPWEMSIRQPPR